MSLYCISVKTGLEEKFKENVLPLVNGNNCAFQGFIHILRKRMRLKNGKNILMLFFPDMFFLKRKNVKHQSFMFFLGKNIFYVFYPQIVLSVLL